MTKHLLLFFTVVFFSVSLVLAQDAGPSYEKKAFSVSAGVDFTNQYFFRGIFQENEGFIAQPYIQLNFLLHETDDIAISIFGGTWNSFHSGPTGEEDGPEDPRAWYEANGYAGVTFAFLEKTLELDTIYTFYTSPNNSFDTRHEMAFRLIYKDHFSDVFSLSPSVTLAAEFDGKGADGGQEHGVYLELALEPTIVLGDTSAFSVSLSAPMTLGLSLDNYYENADGADEAFGYFDVGLAAGIPLYFIPANYGDWELSFSVNFLLLGEHLDAINNDTEFEVIGTSGISVIF